MVSELGEGRIPYVFGSGVLAGVAITESVEDIVVRVVLFKTNPWLEV